MYVPRATYSLRMSFCRVPESAVQPSSLTPARPPRYSASRTMAVALMVIEVDTRSSGMPSNSSRHVLDRVDGDADPPDFTGRQRVVRVVADLRRQVEGDAEAHHALREQVAIACGSTRAAVAKPAYCRIVQGRPRYMVGWMPRVNGNSPGKPISVSGSVPARSAAVRKKRRSDLGIYGADWTYGAAASLATRSLRWRAGRVAHPRPASEELAGRLLGASKPAVKRRFLDTRQAGTLQWMSLRKAKSLRVNTFWRLVLPGLPSRPAGLGSAPDPGPVAVQEEQEWMTS